jgi:CheY-like chemotaxis protein
MAKLLLADPDSTRASALAEALRAAGHDTTVAGSGFYALTMLEHGCPDLIVTRETVGDIEGADLIAVVRADPATRKTPIVLLGGAVDDADLVLHAESSLPALLTGIENVLAVHGRHFAPVAKPPAPAPAATGLRGTLDVMDFPEVAQAIALGQKTGRLSLTVPAGPGLVVFEAGRIIHVEYGVLSGERAFAALSGAAREGGDFCFTAADRADVQSVTRTIQGSVERLLLTAASDMDEGRMVATGATRVEDR